MTFKEDFDAAHDRVNKACAANVAAHRAVEEAKREQVRACAELQRLEQRRANAKQEAALMAWRELRALTTWLRALSPDATVGDVAKHVDEALKRVDEVAS